MLLQKLMLPKKVGLIWYQIGYRFKTLSKFGIKPYLTSHNGINEVVNNYTRSKVVKKE